MALRVKLDVVVPSGSDQDLPLRQSSVAVPPLPTALGLDRKRTVSSADAQWLDCLAPVPMP